MFLLERGRRSALIDGEFGVVIYTDVTCEIVPDMEIVLNCPQFPTKSFGTGDRVKIPGRSAKEPNVYSFGTKIILKFIQTPLLYLLNHISYFPGREISKNLKAA